MDGKDPFRVAVVIWSNMPKALATRSDAEFPTVAIVCYIARSNWSKVGGIDCDSSDALILCVAIPMKLMVLVHV